MNVSLTSGLIAYCMQTLKIVSLENRFVNYDFQQLTPILDFWAPKNGNNELIPKNCCFIK